MKTTSELRKNISIKKLAPFFTALFLMLGTSAFSQENGEVLENEEVANTAVDGFNEWDADTDQNWNEDEYSAWSENEGLYSTWDANADGFYDDNEINNGIFTDWDEDEDGFLSNDEYAKGNSAWEKEYGDHFDTWDANDDNLLDAEEYATGVNDSGLFGDWDTDNDEVYNEDELNRGFFGTYDRDDDGFVSDSEYTEAGFNSDL